MALTFTPPPAGSIVLRVTPQYVISLEVKENIRHGGVYRVVEWWNQYFPFVIDDMGQTTLLTKWEPTEYHE